MHEWLALRAGSEKVFEAFANIDRNADLYAVSLNPSIEFRTHGRPIRTSFLDQPVLRRHRALTLPIMPLTNAILPRQRYDAVLTSSHAFSRWFTMVRRPKLHLCYVHAPARYLWDSSIDARARHDPPLSWGIGAATSVLRRVDRWSCRTVTSFAANSSAVAERLSRYYGVTARIIHPPCDTDFFTPGGRTSGRYLVAVSRFVRYKRLDLAIEAADSAGMDLVIAGSGPDEAHLREVAAKSAHPVRFMISPTDVELRDLLRGSQALIFPAEEDFGILPVEAQACGTPVIAFARGGTLDTVIPGVTGYLADEQTVDSFATAIGDLLSHPLDPSKCRQNSLQFSAQRFDAEILEWLREHRWPGL